MVPHQLATGRINRKREGFAEKQSIVATLATGEAEGAGVEARPDRGNAVWLSGSSRWPDGFFFSAGKCLIQLDSECLIVLDTRSTGDRAAKSGRLGHGQSDEARPLVPNLEEVDECLDVDGA